MKLWKDSRLLLEMLAIIDDNDVLHTDEGALMFYWKQGKCPFIQISTISVPWVLFVSVSVKNNILYGFK